MRDVVRLRESDADREMVGVTLGLRLSDADLVRVAVLDADTEALRVPLAVMERV